MAESEFARFLAKGGRGPLLLPMLLCLDKGGILGGGNGCG